MKRTKLTIKDEKKEDHGQIFNHFITVYSDNYYWDGWGDYRGIVVAVFPYNPSNKSKEVALQRAKRFVDSYSFGLKKETA